MARTRTAPPVVEELFAGEQCLKAGGTATLRSISSTGSVSGRDKRAEEQAGDRSAAQPTA